MLQKQLRCWLWLCTELLVAGRYDRLLASQGQQQGLVNSFQQQLQEASMAAERQRLHFEEALSHTQASAPHPNPAFDSIRGRARCIHVSSVTKLYAPSWPEDTTCQALAQEVCMVRAVCQKVPHVQLQGGGD